jgi:hypothetical protein
LDANDGNVFPAANFPDSYAGCLSKTSQLEANSDILILESVFSSTDSGLWGPVSGYEHFVI